MATMGPVSQQALLFNGPIHIRPIIDHKSDPVERQPKFDPEIHLAYKTAAKVLSMEDVGYPQSTGISPVAISEAFPLFTPEAIQLMRNEFFTEEVWDNCLYLAGNSSACHPSGHSPR